ncbi:MAG TPA: hypothetical protein VNO70_20525 [Blastocatellia bacterium]|nr:hypothetical protein [Blastocatellia bacterium]
MKRIFLDIETLPPDEQAREALLREMAHKITAAGARPAYEQAVELADRRFREMALEGEHGRVLAIGLIIEQDGRVIHSGLLGRDRATGRFHLDERRTLRSFWKLLREFDARRDVIAGHNIFDFDLLFLYKRSIIHGARPAVSLSFARYRSQPIYDTMREWEKWGRNRISLGRLAAALGLESSKQGGLDGGSVYDAFRAGRHEEIASYCMRDVELVRAIYYRLNFLEMQEGRGELCA